MGWGGGVDGGLSSDYGANRVYKNVAQRVLHCTEYIYCDNCSMLDVASTSRDLCLWRQKQFEDLDVDMKYEDV